MVGTQEKEVEDKYLKAVISNLREVMRTVGSKEILSLYLKEYDKLASIEEAEAGSAIKGKDPLSLTNLRGLFERQLKNEIAASKFVEGEWQISLMDKELLGYSQTESTGEPTTVDVLAFYLEGVPDEHAFITTQQYDLGRKGSSRGNNAGRLGAGFLMTKSDYLKEGWEKITGLSFDQVRHPISSQKRFSGFESLPSKIDFSKYITLAIEMTNASFNS